MAKFEIPVGSTSIDIPVSVYDSSSTTGAKLAGLVYNTSSLTGYYSRQGASGAATQISLATKTKGTWATGGFVAVDGTNMPGDYELGVPDASLAAGAKWVEIQLKGAANMVPVNITIELTAVSNQDAVRGGMTALPNANAEAAGGLYTRGTGAGQIAQDAYGNVRVNLDTIKTQVVTCGAGVTVNPNVGMTQPVNFTGTGASALVKTDVTDWNGTAVASPATAGVPQVNVAAVNNVAATSVTTVSAYQGSTQPLNFTGTGASALAKSDMVDVAGAAVSTSAAQIGVNAVQHGGTSQTGRDIGASVLLSVGTGTGQVNLSSGKIPATLASTDVTGNVAADVQTIKTQAVTCSAGVTVNPNVGMTQPINFTGTGVSALVKSDMVDIAGVAISTTSAQIGVNAVNVGGTAQTGRDLGASVLISPGTGAGQLDVTSGVVKANLVQILATALTETSGLIAGAFKKFFNVAAPTGTVNSIPDAVAGATGGIAIVGSIMGKSPATLASTDVTGNLPADVKAWNSGSLPTVGDATAANQTTLINRLGAFTGSGVNTVLGFLKALLSKTASTPSDVGGTFDPATDSTEAIRDTAPLGTTMRGTDNAALAATALSNATWTDTKAGYLDAAVSSRLAPTVPARTLDVSATGEAGVDWANVGSPSATVGLSGTVIAESPATLSSAQRNAVADAYLDRTDAIETGLTPRNAHKLEAAAAAGTVAGGGTSVVTIKSAVSDAKTRITADVDLNGNRTSVTTDFS